MKISYFSTKGKIRKTNQDQSAYFEKSKNEFIALVCDGMGGSLGGSIASSTLSEFLIEEYKNAPSFVFKSFNEIKEWFNDVIKKTLKNWEITINENPIYKKMGTTIVCAIFVKEILYIANIGDSRAYFYNDEDLNQITKDHSLPHLLFEKGLINEKQIKNHPQKNILYNVVVFDKKYDIDWFKIKNPKGAIILMSDGIYNLIDNLRMWEILNSKTSIESKVVEFCNEADDRGGFDNSTILIGMINAN